MYLVILSLLLLAGGFFFKKLLDFTIGGGALFRRPVLLGFLDGHLFAAVAGGGDEGNGEAGEHRSGADTGHRAHGVHHADHLVGLGIGREAIGFVTELADLLESLDDFSLAHQEEVVMKWIEDKGYHLGNIMNAFRLTLVGEGKGPHMFDISAVLGKEETIQRMRRAIEVLK